MHDIFGYSDYKKFIRAHVESLPKSGWGEHKRMATALRISPVLFSQVLRGDRDLSFEQACDLASYLALRRLERDYLLLLVQKARVGSHRAQLVVEEQMEEIRARALELTQGISHEKLLGPNEQQRFYSSWHYSAVRLYFDVNPRASVDEISRRFNLPATRVREIMGFLLESGLCVQTRGGISLGPRTTHLPSSSPYIYQHRMNWRFKALELQGRLVNETDLSYSGLACVSKESAMELRKQIVRLLDKITKTAASDKAEVLSLLNIDWISI